MDEWCHDSLEARQGPFAVLHVRISLRAASGEATEENIYEKY